MFGQFRAMLAWSENGFLEQVACGGSPLVDGGKAHAAALIELDGTGPHLKRARSHAANVFYEVIGRDGPGARLFNGETLGACGERGVVAARELDLERLAPAGAHPHIDGALAGVGALEHVVGTVDCRLATNDAHAAPLPGRSWELDIEYLAGGGITAGEGREERVRIIVVAQLKEIACPNGRVECEVGGARRPLDGRSQALPLGLGLAHGEPSDAAHELASIVRSLVAHHVVVGGAVLVRVREVAVKAALELALTSRLLLFARIPPRKDVVELAAVYIRYREDVVGGLHATFELERRGACVHELGEQVGRAGVARAERPTAAGCRDLAPLLVNELVG